ncbi:MAG: hypothetical protein SFW36_23515, partial [Leptolyngbyaceae cyanobacterium bins.59]|nr:hypothetical protein [Leptolyngbyaceae cyanobacterium bins.59]
WSASNGCSAMNALRSHYPEYLMEAAGLGLFMISASVGVGTVGKKFPLYHPLVMILFPIPR